VRNGFARSLTRAAEVSFAPELARRAGGAHAAGLLERGPGGALVWGGEVEVAGAHRLRLHLGAVRLPAGALLWVYGADGETVGPFGLELRGPGGDLWTPSVAGEVIRLEVQLPAGAAPAADHGFVIDRVLEIVSREQLAALAQRMSLVPRLGECLMDAACVTSSTFAPIDFVKRAVAALQFTDGVFNYACSGSLLNDFSDSGTPFLLTANHCFDDQALASTLEAFWDYVPDSCGGSPPASLPRSTGATLLASDPSSDFTLVHLNNLPGGRVFLGFNADPSAVAHGTTLHRLSHPVDPNDPVTVLSQQYSRSMVDTSLSICQLDGLPLDRPQFVYHTPNMGGTFGGSSGAATIALGSLPTEEVWVVGQLSGGCPQQTGVDPSDGCDYRNAEVDGAFSESYETIGPFLRGERCIPTNTTLCLLDGRFKVEVDWRNQADRTGEGKVVPVESNDSGLFYFFDSDNWEMLVKMVDGCGLFNHYWVFYAATTNVEFTLTVTDTESGMSREYRNELGVPAPPVQDTSAFATCP